MAVASREDALESVAPDFMVEVQPHATLVKVYFYDEARSLRFIFGFDKTGDKLFHSSVTEYTYPDNNRKYSQSECTLVETLTFQPDGLVHQWKNDKSGPTIEEADYRNVDVTSHWEPIPEFGQWESLGRWRRE